MAKLELKCKGKYLTLKKLEKHIEKFLKENMVEYYSIKTNVTIFEKEDKDERMDTHFGNN